MVREIHQQNIPATFVTRPATAHFPLDGTLIIKLQILDAMVGRVLLHDGLEGNIIFRGTAEKMVYRRAQLRGWLSSVRSALKRILPKL